MREVHKERREKKGERERILSRKFRTNSKENK
jgi:hypothetical protein